MSTGNAHYMNTSKEMTIWNVSAKNDWNEKRQNYFAFNDFSFKRCFARYPKVQGIPFQLVEEAN